jgi:hypothetical protein
MRFLQPIQVAKRGFWLIKQPFCAILSLMRKNHQLNRFFAYLP